MPLPIVACPCCRVSMSLDVLLIDDSARDALYALVGVHPAGESFVKPLLRYIGLFAPPKSQMSYSRIGALVNELAPMVRDAKIERNGRTWPCPIDYWRQGFEHMLSMRDQGRLNLPLKSHGYLLEVLAGMSDKAEAKAETQTENRRAGVTQIGAPAPKWEAAPDPTPRAEHYKPVRTESASNAIAQMRSLTKQFSSPSEEKAS